MGAVQLQSSGMAGSEGGCRNGMLGSHAAAYQHTVQAMPMPYKAQQTEPLFHNEKFKNKLQVTVSDQMGCPRHRYGKSFPSSQIQYDPGSSAASSPTPSWQGKPQKQSKQQQQGLKASSVCEAGLPDGYLY